MGIREWMKRDLTEVMVNAAEFATVRNLNGVESECIVESVSYGGTDLNSAEYEGYDGYHKQMKVVHLPEWYIEVPVRGQVFKLDGEIYLVEKVELEDGLMSVYLGGYNGG